MANINKVRLNGTTYDLQDKNAAKTVELTQAEYDGLAVKEQNVFYIITDAEVGDLSNYYTKGETDTLLGGKQPTLVSGTNIKTINNESLLGEGNIDIQGGGSSVNVVQTTGTSTSDVMSQDAVTKAFKTYTLSEGSSAYGKIDSWEWRSPYNGKILKICNFALNGKFPLSKEEGDANTDYEGYFNFHLVETSAVTTSVSSTSTDTQVPSAKAVYDQLGGLKLVKLTQSQYDALQTKDPNTLFIVTDS